MASNSRRQLEDYLKKLHIKADRCLDIGGSAYPVKNRVGLWDVKEYEILDNNNEKKFHEKWENPKFSIDIDNEIELGRFREKIIEEDKLYDYIFMLEVSEYLIDIKNIFENIYCILKNNGKFIFTTHFIYPIHNPVENDYIRMTGNGIIKILKDIGFTKVKITPRKSKDIKFLMAFYQQEGMRYSKEIDHNIIGHIIEATK